MEINLYVLLVSLGTAFVTLIPRVVPLVVLSRLDLPEWFTRWLNYVPISVMAALIGQEIFLNEGELVPFQHNLKLWAALPTVIVAVWTRSLVATVVTGAMALMILRFFIS
ncbi:branched-chain amino acid ABC transporter [Paenibacillus swuensis]|uniref:Branched-chain amino acid ABC transporter n=1 Tax=Paenibacillus swuensis TaxID=1178515 RepID=A0A172TLG6_9BACL|nr:AzlD domain-containing protein [Paenibacillus swuensis]ANE47822.1 branched-chain amino acid ABC transporter [Paenibacillus swuensis]